LEVIQLNKDNRRLESEVEAFSLYHEELERLKTIIREQASVSGHQTLDMESKELNVNLRLENEKLQALTVALKEQMALLAKELEDLLAEKNDWKDRFSSMKFYADSLNQENERLVMEAETVPLYIEKYQVERKRIQAKSAQKDQMINDLIRKYNDLLEQLKQQSPQSDQQSQDELVKEDANSTSIGGPIAAFRENNPDILPVCIGCVVDQPTIEL
jgi:chromosome segregation ATPase